MLKPKTDTVYTAYKYSPSRGLINKDAPERMTYGDVLRDHNYWLPIEEETVSELPSDETEEWPPAPVKRALEKYGPIECWAEIGDCQWYFLVCPELNTSEYAAKDREEGLVRLEELIQYIKGTDESPVWLTECVCECFGWPWNKTRSGKVHLTGSGWMPHDFSYDWSLEQFFSLSVQEASRLFFDMDSFVESADEFCKDGGL